MRLGINSPVDLEVRDSDQTVKLSGYAAVFYNDKQPGTEFRLLEDYVERIMPGAFDGIERSDVRALVNHDPNKLLGRTSAGTLRLGVDDVGLRYAIQLPDTADARDVAALVRRGDITGSSFGFRVIEQERRQEGETYVREIHQVEVADVGPVTFPAYDGTQAVIRAQDLSETLREFDAWKLRHERKLQRILDRANARARVVHLQKAP